MNILFVCRYNKFRSKLAEAWFKKLCTNKDHVVRSAGLTRGRDYDPSLRDYDKGILDAAEKSGLEIVREVNGLTSDIMKWYDMVVIVANDVPKEVFPGKVVVWGVADAEGYDLKNRIKISNDIKAKVENFISEIN